MNDNDTTLIPGSDSSALAGKLQRIADYERGLKTIPRVLQSAGRTPGVRRFLPPVRTESRSLAVSQDPGPGRAAARFARSASHHNGCQVGAAPGDVADLRA